MAKKEIKIITGNTPEQLAKTLELYLNMTGDDRWHMEGNMQIVQGHAQNFSGQWIICPEYVQMIVRVK